MARCDLRQTHVLQGLHTFFRVDYLAEPDEIERFNSFTQKLAELSKEYGFVLQVIGGVYVYELDDPSLPRLRYTNDLSSLDLEPRGLPGW